MTGHEGRRKFLSRIGAIGGAAWIGGSASVAQQRPRRLRIGHTGITWGYQPDDAARAIPDVASLGYRGYETFGEVLEAWERKGGLSKVLEENKLPLISAYCNVNLTDPTKRADEVGKMVGWARLIRKCDGVTAVIGPLQARVAFGLFTERCGAEGYLQWAFQWPHQLKSPYASAASGRFEPYQYVLPAPDGPLPTVDFELAREGIIDARYLALARSAGIATDRFLPDDLPADSTAIGPFARAHADGYFDAWRWRVARAAIERKP